MTAPFAIDLSSKFLAFDEYWRPRVAAQLNGQDVRLVKTKGVFPWHSHPDAEEMFLVFHGQFRVEFRDHVVELGPGQLLVVPRGVEHRTASDEEAHVIVFEPSELVNTGDAPVSPFTAPLGVSI